MFGPVIFELRNLKVEASKRVSTKKKSSTFSCSQTKIFLEEICSHLSIAMRIGMTFFFWSLPRLETRFWTTVRSSGVKLEWLRPFNFTICIHLSQMVTNFMILILKTIGLLILLTYPHSITNSPMGSPAQPLLFLITPHSTATVEAKVHKSALLLPLSAREIFKAWAELGKFLLVKISSRMSAVISRPALSVFKASGKSSLFWLK